MAKLEFYRQQVVPRIATPSARGLAAVESPLAQVAGSITQGATALAKLSADLDEMRVEDAYNTLRTKQTELMMNPETGFMSKRSADAVAPDFMSRYVTDFDKEVEFVPHPRVYRKLYWKSASIRGFQNQTFPEFFAEAAERILDLYYRGRLQAWVDPTSFQGLKQVADASEHLLAGRNQGKVVIAL